MFRWWWPLVVSKPQPPLCFRTALVGVSLLPTETSINTASQKSQCLKRDCNSSLFTDFTQLLSVFSADLVPVTETFAWKFQLCLRNICSPASLAITDALLLYWFNNFYSLPSLTSSRYLRHLHLN